MSKQTKIQSFTMPSFNTDEIINAVANGTTPKIEKKVETTKEPKGEAVQNTLLDLFKTNAIEDIGALELVRVYQPNMKRLKLLKLLCMDSRLTMTAIMNNILDKFFKDYDKEIQQLYQENKESMFKMFE